METIQAPAFWLPEERTLIPLVVSSFHPPELLVGVLIKSPFPGSKVLVVGKLANLCTAMLVGKVAPVVCAVKLNGIVCTTGLVCACKKQTENCLYKDPFH